MRGEKRLRNKAKKRPVHGHFQRLTREYASKAEATSHDVVPSDSKLIETCIVVQVKMTTWRGHLVPLGKGDMLPGVLRLEDSDEARSFYPII